MAVVIRSDSPYYWITLERPGQRPIRESTYIPIKAPTPDQARENKQLAEALYSAKMGDLARDRHGLPTERARIKFKVFRRWYLEHIAVHKRNEIRERSMAGKLGEYFDDVDVGAIDLPLALEWRTKRAREVAPGTVNREIDLLRHMLGVAVPKYRAARLVGLAHLRVPEREPRLLDRDEEVRLLKALDVEMRAVVICALDTLQRLSSVADLKRAQDHGDYITFLNTKTKGGKVPVSTRLRKALDRLPEHGAFYFPSLQVGTVSARRNKLIRVFTAACDEAGIMAGQAAGGITFHCLRHTGASRMLEAGTDIETVRRIGGWADLDVLKRYLHPTDDASRRAVESIGRRTPSPKARTRAPKTRN